MFNPCTKNCEFQKPMCICYQKEEFDQKKETVPGICDDARGF
jgi:hypothetical protein